MIPSILSFITGNAAALGKWAAILAAITLIGVVFNAFESKGAAETALAAQVEETQQANQALSEVVDEYAKRDAAVEEKAALAAQYRRRALFAERKLGNLVAAGDTAAITERLCNILRSIEGSEGDGGKALDCADRTPYNASNTYYKISEQSVVNMLANFERIRSYIDQTQPHGAAHGTE